MKIKAIDLLYRIANEIEVPNKIKLLSPTLKEEYKNCTWNGCWYEHDEDGSEVTFCTNFLDLNDEIEIIEEENMIDKLEEWVKECKENTGFSEYEAGINDALTDVLIHIRKIKKNII